MDGLHQHKKCNGNIAFTAEIDLSEQTEFQKHWVLEKPQMKHPYVPWGSLLDGFDSLQHWCMQDWEKWTKGLEHLPAKNYKVSAMAMRMHEAGTFPVAL